MATWPLQCLGPECHSLPPLPFMHLAVVGKAHALVSGDRDLLAIDGVFEHASVLAF